MNRVTYTTIGGEIDALLPDGLETELLAPLQEGLGVEDEERVRADIAREVLSPKPR